MIVLAAIALVLFCTALALTGCTHSPPGPDFTPERALMAMGDPPCAIPEVLTSNRGGRGWDLVWIWDMKCGQVEYTCTSHPRGSRWSLPVCNRGRTFGPVRP